MAVHEGVDPVHFTPVVQKTPFTGAFVTFCDARMMQTEDLVINKVFYINKLSGYPVI